MQPKQVTVRDILLREYESRKIKNAFYSLRAFARDLEIPASNLSLVLRGKKGFSQQRAHHLARKLMLNDDETELLVLLAKSEHARSPIERKQAKDKIKAMDAVFNYEQVDNDKFQLISDWHYYAILELTDVQDFVSEIPWIARRLQLSETTVAQAIDKLLEVKMLSFQNGVYKQTQEHLTTPNGIPSQAIRKYNRQIMALAETKLDGVPIEERDFSTMTMALDEKSYVKATQLIKDFRRNLTKLLQSTRTKNRVYCLSMQFFPMDKKDLR